MRIQLVTFGGLHVHESAGALEPVLTQRSRAAMFVYLTVERRVTRDALMSMFWPESTSENARHALRQGLYHLRKALRRCDWISARGHELVACADVEADVTAFTEAADHGDLERVVRLYHGPFLDGVHLVDLRSWESWVDHRRTRYGRVFRKACRELIDTGLANHDVAGAIATAERWTALDPSDDEAQHRLISTLVLAGERAGAIRQYESYARVLSFEGLEPLDETRALVDRLRTRRRRSDAA